MEKSSSQSTELLQIEELNNIIEVKLPEDFDRMDFADRLEYFWNLSEK